MPQVKKLNLISYDISIEHRGEFRLVIEQNEQFVEWHLLQAEYDWCDDGDAENGPHVSRDFRGWKGISYGMGGCKEEEVLSFVEREIEEDAYLTKVNSWKHPFPFPLKGAQTTTKKIPHRLNEAMTIAELIEESQDLPPDTKVLFTCDYGDHHHTMQALPAKSLRRVPSSAIEESGYSHSGFALTEGYDDADGFDDRDFVSDYDYIALYC